MFGTRVDVWDVWDVPQILSRSQTVGQVTTVETCLGDSSLRLFQVKMRDLEHLKKLGSMRPDQFGQMTTVRHPPASKRHAF